MPDIQVIEDPAAAAVVLDPIRAKILAVLAEPGSATTVAKALDLPRQRSTTTCACSRLIPWYARSSSGAGVG